MSVCITREVEVEIDLGDYVDELTEKELAELGLRAVSDGDPELPVTDTECWRQVARAVRHGDRRTLLDLLSRMARDQANVVIPVVGLAPLH